MNREEQIRELEEIKLDIENIMSRVKVFIGDCGTIFSYASPENVLTDLESAEGSVSDTIYAIKDGEE